MARNLLRDRTDDELAANAQSGMQGQGAVVEAMRRLRKSNECLTYALILLTVVLVGIEVWKFWRGG